MRSVDVVIGSGYGDEGKGLVTDYLASKYDPSKSLVVRFNGGAQAGHTVVTPDGDVHVFHHFGSGSFHGTPTLLSKFFVVNPPLFFKELEALQALSLTPSVTVSADCLVTTPFDVAINQAVEQFRKRSNNHHGSCGVGFNETIERSQQTEFKLTVTELYVAYRRGNTDALRKRLLSMITTYVPDRLRYLVGDDFKNIWMMPAWPFHSQADVEEIVDNFLRASMAFVDYCDIEYDVVHLEKPDHVIFEGAQGLLLDEGYGVFPHVTRSRTGLTNVAYILRFMDNYGVADVHYVTRTYQTRHGAGPLSHEIVGRPYPDVRDTTNVTNPWQEHFRYARLDLDLVLRAIDSDFSATGRAGITANKNLVMTCCDQLGDRDIKFYHMGDCQSSSVEELGAKLHGNKFANVFLSYGNTRDCIKSPFNVGLAKTCETC